MKLPKWNSIKIGGMFPDCDIRGDEPSRLREGICAASVTIPKCSPSFLWNILASGSLHTSAREF